MPIPEEMYPIRDLARTCHRENPSLPYTENAFYFIYAGMDYARRQFQTKGESPRHLTGAEFSRILCDYARSCFGPLAAHVLHTWGIHRTRDFGELVYLFIDAGLFTRTQEDRIEDFNDVFDFSRAFLWPPSPDNPWP